MVIFDTTWDKTKQTLINSWILYKLLLCCQLSYHYHESDYSVIVLYPAPLVSRSPELPINSNGGRNGFDTQSDVYKMLQDYEEPVSEPKQSGSFKYLQGILEAEDGGRVFCVCVCVCFWEFLHVCVDRGKHQVVPLQPTAVNASFPGARKLL